MKLNSLSLVIVILFSLCIISASVTAQLPTTTTTQLIQGEPRLDTHAPNPILQPGETTELTIQISNHGSVTAGAPENRDIVTTARNVRLQVSGEDTPITVKSGQQAIGSVTESQPGQATITVTTPNGIDPGTYELTVELRYAHTATLSQSSGITQDRTRTVTRTIEVRIEDRARFEFSDIATDAKIGDSGTLTATLENTGNEEATNILATLESTSPHIRFGESQTDSVRVSTLNPGETMTLVYDVTVLPGASVREYSFNGVIKFTDPDGIETTESGLSIGMRPLAKQTFGFSNIDSSLQVGERGKVTGTIINHGPTTARNTVIQVVDESPTIIPIEPTVAVGELAVGESATFELPIEISTAGEPVNRTIDLAVRYQTPSNENRIINDLESPMVTVNPAQDFSIDSIESTLRVGEEGELTGVITNTGPTTVRNAVLQLSHESPNVILIEHEVAIGSLAVGDSAAFRVPVEITREAESLSTIFDMSVRYRNDHNDVRHFEKLDTVVEITDRRDEFLLSVRDREVTAGSSVLLTIDVTNNLDDPVTDIEGRLFTDSPLSSVDDEAYIESLGPGESATITFEISVSRSAVAKAYPVRIDFRYDDSRSNSKISETYRVPIAVIEPTENRMIWFLSGILVIMLAVGGAWYWHRSQ